MPRDPAISSLASRRSVHRANKGRRWPKRVIIGVAIVLILAVIGGVGGWFYVNSVLGSIKRVPVPSITPETSGAPINILLVGSDSWAFVDSSGQASSFGSATAQTGQRSDVIIVVRLVPKTRQIVMLSIPRDTYVPIREPAARTGSMPPSTPGRACWCKRSSRTSGSRSTTSWWRISPASRAW